MSLESLKTWAKLIALTGTAQVLVQAIGFIAGILVIRQLPVYEYALYTMANTMLGTMTILADSGIAIGVMSQGGKVWRDKQKLGAVLFTGMALRKKFAVFSLLVAVPILFYLLRKHEASWLMSGMIVLSLIPAFFASLSSTLLEIPVKLHQDIKPLQTIQVQANLGRLALLGLTMFVFPFAAVAIVCAGASQSWSNWRLRSVSVRYAGRDQQEDLEARSIMLKLVKQKMPESIYYCLSGQITILLLSLFGTTTSVAEVGALSRLAMVLNVVNAMLILLVVPRFARLDAESEDLIRKYAFVLIALLFFCVAILLAVRQFPLQLLMILGEGYRGLGGNVPLSLSHLGMTILSIDLLVQVSPLMLMATGGCLSLLAGVAYSLNSARGIIIPPMLIIPYSIAVQALLIFMLDISQITGVLAMSIVLSLLQLSLYTAYFRFIILKKF